MANYASKVPAGTPNTGSYRGLWQASQTWASGDIVVPTVGYGTAAAKKYVYVCTTGGAGGGTEPTWVYTTPGTSTTTDSAAVWTCQEATSWAYATPRPDYVINNRMAAGDMMYSEAGTYTISANTTITMPGSASSISAWIATSDTTNFPPTTITTSGTLVSMDMSATTSGIGWTLNGRGLLSGIELKTGGSTNAGSILLLSNDEDFIQLEYCKMTISNSSASSLFRIGASGAGNVRLRSFNTTWTTGNSTGQTYQVGHFWESENDTFAITTAVPSVFLTPSNGSGMSGDVEMIGCNISALSSSSLVAGSSTIYTRVVMRQCKLGASIAFLATQTSYNHSELWVYDCASGNTHYEFGHYNYLGNTTVSTGIYVNTADGAAYNAADAKISWKITGVNGTLMQPYRSPWIVKYNEGTSAVTPRLEILRDGSSTAYNDDVVWGEFSAKTTASVVISTIYRDRRGLVASAAAQTTGALGAADWTGENATAWFGKLEPTSSITPSATGSIAARVCVAGANTVYVNPKILST